MENDKLEPTSPENRAENESGCGPGCNCGGAKISTKGKVIICLVIAIAAAIVLANSVMQKAETVAEGELNAFTAKALVTDTESPQNDKANSSLWDKPLESLASLNEVAGGKDAVFLYLPARGQSPDENVKKEIEAAAGKAQLQGKKIHIRHI